MNVTVSEALGVAGSQAGNASPEASLGTDGDELGPTDWVTPALEGLALEAPADAGAVGGGAVPGPLSPGAPEGVEMQPDSAKTTDANVTATDLRIGLPSGSRTRLEPDRDRPPSMPPGRQGSVGEDDS